MIKKAIREVLSDDELYDLACSYALVLKVGQGIPGMEQEVATAEKNFVNLMKGLPEHTHRTTTSHCDGESGVCYTEFVKKIGNDISWFSSGLITIDGRISWGDYVYTQPWEPTDPEAKKRREAYDKQYKLDFEKTLTGIDVEERLERERLSNISSFESALNKYNMALVKFQRQTLEKKRIVPLKRFTMDGKKFYEVMDTFTNTVLSCEDNEDNIKVLKAAIRASSDKLDKLELSMEQLFNHRLFVRRSYNSNTISSCDFCISTFKNSFEANSAIERYALQWNDNSGERQRNGWYARYNHQACESLTEDNIDIKMSGRVNRLYHILNGVRGVSDTILANCLCYYDLVSQLADAKDEQGNPRVWMFREFCETMGLLAPKKEEESEEIDGSKEHH